MKLPDATMNSPDAGRSFLISGHSSGTGPGGLQRIKSACAAPLCTLRTSMLDFFLYREIGAFVHHGAGIPVSVQAERRAG